MSDVVPFRGLIDLFDFNSAIDRLEETQFAPGELSKVNTIVSATEDIERQCNRKFIPVEDTEYYYNACIGSLLAINELVVSGDNLIKVYVFGEVTALTLNTDYILLTNRERSAYDRILRLRAGLPVSWRIDHEVGELLVNAVRVTGTEGFATTIPQLAKQECEVRAVRLWVMRSNLYLEGQGGTERISTVSPPLDLDQITRLKPITRAPLNQMGRIGA